ncbi:MAG: PhoU domain-containing protein [Nitrospinota bacterium]
MSNIIMDDMNNTRDDISNLIVLSQQACRLAIKLIHDDPDSAEIVDKIKKMERKGDKEKVRITEDLSDIVGKLFLAGLLKRAVVCDSVVVHEGEAMLDLLDSLAENWMRIKDANPSVITDEIVVLLDSMLQNCIVMIEKTVEALRGKEMDSHTLAFIVEVDKNINQANTKAHEVVLSMADKDKSSIIRLIRIVKSLENLGDKIKSVASYLLFIRTGEFVKV